MPICDYCGDEIEFRYLEGRPTPIHINGGWCRGYADKSAAVTKQFSSDQSYTNPNAHCPVCGKQVYFYQSPYGGRVFFNNLGWPWPKHGCTDKSEAQRNPVVPIIPKLHKTFISRRGRALFVYALVDLIEDEEGLFLKFRRINQLVSIKIFLSFQDLQSKNVTVDDLRDAPSFVEETFESHRTLQFICGRKGGIVTLTAPRTRSSP